MNTLKETTLGSTILSSILCNSDNFAVRVHVVGCGGIGGWLIPLLARECVVRKIDLLLYDGDTVESKNLVRQNFIVPDIGQNKAIVLAKRYSCLGRTITAVPKYITAVNSSSTISYDDFATNMYDPVNGTSIYNIIVICADNVKVRYLIYAKLIHTHCCIIDAGNDIEYGQVNFTCCIPTPRGSYKTMKTWILEEKPSLGKDASEASCDDLANVKPQIMSINNIGAAFAMQYITNILNRTPITTKTIKFYSDLSASKVPMPSYDEFIYLNQMDDLYSSYYEKQMKVIQSQATPVQEITNG